MEKENIVKIFELYSDARKKTEKLEKSIEQYSGDRAYVPTVHQSIEKMISILWEEIFKDAPESVYDMNWFEWHIYENNFGENKLSIIVDNVEYKILSNEDMADFLLKWVERQSKSEKNK